MTGSGHRHFDDFLLVRRRVTSPWQRRYTCVWVFLLSAYCSNPDTCVGAVYEYWQHARTHVLFVTEEHT